MQRTTPTRLRFTASPFLSRTASMAINSSTSHLRNRGRPSYATRHCATRFLPTRIRPTTGARSRSVTKTHGTRCSMSNPATNSISRQQIVCRFGSNSQDDTFCDPREKGKEAVISGILTQDLASRETSKQSRRLLEPTSPPCQSEVYPNWALSLDSISVRIES